MEFIKLNIQLFAGDTTDKLKLTSTAGNYGYLQASFEEVANSVNTNTNKNKVKVKATLTQKTGSWAQMYTPLLEIWWYDNNKNKSGIKVATTEVSKLSSGDVKTAEGTIEVEHLADGSLKGYAQARWLQKVSSSYVYQNGTISTDNIPLTIIPRANTFKNVPDSANVGQGFTVTLNQKSTSFSTKLVCTCNGKSQEVTTFSDTATFSLPGTTFDSAFGSTESKKTATITATTYNGSTQIGDAVTDTVVLYLPSSTYKPSISISAVDTNSTTKTLTGDSTGKTCVLNASTIACTINAKSQNNATISSLAINGANVATNTTSYTISNSKTNKFTASVKDSRGFVNEATATLNVVNYFKPTITALFKRNTPTDGKVTLKYSGTIFNKSFGAKANTFTFYYEYKLKSASSYTRVTLTPTISGNTFSGNLTLSGTYDYKQNYSFRLCVVDAINTVVYVQDITKGTPVYWWNESSVNINGTLNCSGNVVVANESKGKAIIADDYVQSPNGFKGKRLSNGQGQSGYMYAFDITTTNSYINQYITFDILQRNRRASVELCFSSSGTAGTIAVSKILKTGSSKIYYVVANNVFSLYIQKSEGYDDIEICNLQKGTYMNATKITWKNQTVASLPSGYKEVGVESNANVMTATLSTTSSYTISTAWNYVKLPLDNLKPSIGSKLTFTSNSIKIGAGVSYVKVSANAMMNGIAMEEILQICRNSDIVSQGYYRCTNVSHYGVVSLSPVLIKVYEGDLITLKYGSGGTGTLKIAGGTYTYLTVEVVE